ncbi:RNA-binding protein spenito, partial [Frankliniella fusca]
DIFYLRSKSNHCKAPYRWVSSPAVQPCGDKELTSMKQLPPQARDDFSKQLLLIINQFHSLAELLL